MCSYQHSWLNNPEMTAYTEADELIGKSCEAKLVQPCEADVEYILFIVFTILSPLLQPNN